MSFDIFINIIAGLLSLIGVVAFSEVSKNFVKQVFNRGEPEETYSQKLTRLTKSLVNSSSEVDNVLSELSQVARDRENAVHRLERELHQLENREKELKDKVKVLENVPIPVAEHFAKLTAVGERRNALRDYALFGAGVVLSTIITIVLQIFGT